MEGRSDWGRYDFGTFRRRDVLTMGRYDGKALVYQTPTKSYQSQIPVAFGIPGHVTTKHLPDTPC